MKKHIFYLTMSLSILILAFYSFLHFKEKSSLTKENVCSIINNIDGTILAVMAKNGEKELSNNSKLDFVVKYIIENKEKFTNIVETSNSKLERNGTIYYNFGKVKQENIYTLTHNFFEEFDNNMNSSMLYDNGYIELFFEPIEYVSYDFKQVSSYYIYKGKIYTYVKYIRSMRNKENKFTVKYIFDEDTYRIDNIIILNSIMN